MSTCVPEKAERGHAGKCLHYEDEQRRNPCPRKNVAQSAPSIHESGGVKNEARFTETVVRPLGPSREENPFFP